jgi:hypothetical protein
LRPRKLPTVVYAPNARYPIHPAADAASPRRIQDFRFKSSRQNTSWLTIMPADHSPETISGEALLPQRDVGRAASEPIGDLVIRLPISQRQHDARSLCHHVADSLRTQHAFEFLTGPLVA